MYFTCINVQYLVTGEHVFHHALMFRGVVAVVGGSEGPVRTGAERKKTVKLEIIAWEEINKSVLP